MIEFIVSGVARSGTTALAAALCLHPQVFCATEHLRPGDDHRGRFRPERFFQGTGHQGFLEKDKEILAGKRELVAIGNKHPHYFNRWNGVLDQLADGRALFILREPLDVMASWNRRAANERDPWSEGRTGIFALLDMIEAMRAIHASRHAAATLFVGYEALFFGERCREVFDAALRFLAAAPDDDIARSFLTQIANQPKLERPPAVDRNEVALAEIAALSPLIDAVNDSGAIPADRLTGQADEVLGRIESNKAALVPFFAGKTFLPRYLRSRRSTESPLLRFIADALDLTPPATRRMPVSRRWPGDRRGD